MQICRPFHDSANAADSTVGKTHRLIEMMNREERPPDKRDRSRARGRKVFEQSRTLGLRISARIGQSSEACLTSKVQDGVELRRDRAIFRIVRIGFECR